MIKEFKNALVFGAIAERIFEIQEIADFASDNTVVGAVEGTFDTGAFKVIINICDIFGFFGGDSFREGEFTVATGVGFGEDGGRFGLVIG